MSPSSLKCLFSLSSPLSLQRWFHGSFHIFVVRTAVIYHWRKSCDHFWSNCVGKCPRRKWLVNHCLLSHFAHGKLTGFGTHWVVAVLSDSCGAQCLKLSSNVWHMVCVSLWPVTLVVLNYPGGFWLAEWKMRHRYVPINEPRKGGNAAWATFQPNVSKKLVKITPKIPCTCVTHGWKCLILPAHLGQSSEWKLNIIHKYVLDWRFRHLFVELLHSWIFSWNSNIF